MLPDERRRLIAAQLRELGRIAPVTDFGLVLAADVPRRALRAPALAGVEVQRA
jgi:hypothetical protein